MSIPDKQPPGTKRAPAQAGIGLIPEKQPMTPTSPARMTPTSPAWGSGTTSQSESDSGFTVASANIQDSTASESGKPPVDDENFGDPTQHSLRLAPSEEGRKPRVTQGRGREVLDPFLQRDDVGKYAVYQGNWGGRKRMEQVNNHLLYDIVVDCKCQVVCAQEVDVGFIEQMKDPRGGGRKAPASAGKNARFLSAGRRSGRRLTLGMSRTVTRTPPKVH